MNKKTFILIITVVCLLILFINPKIFQSARQAFEQTLIIPVRRLTQGEIEESTTPLKLLSLKEKNQKLKKENQVLRKQLGAIPFKSRLYPAEVIWQSDTQYIVNFPYVDKQKIVANPVVWQEQFLGTVFRQGESMLYIRKPTHSSFQGEGISDQQTEGKIKGQFNHQVIFETNSDNQLSKGDQIYLVDHNRGVRFLVGKITRIEKDERLPVKQGVIEYIPRNLKLQTVFIVI